MFSKGIAMLLFSISLFAHTPPLIDGEIVDKDDFRSIVDMRTDVSGCTGTLVGPRVVVTAAHCFGNGEMARFSVGEREYQARITNSPLYWTQSHDIALGFVTEPVEDVEFSSVGGKAEVGTMLTLFGYGCHGSGPVVFDEELRRGVTQVIDQWGFYLESEYETGATLCSGDSGGPAFVLEDGHPVVVGVNSAVTVFEQTNLNLRIDIEQTKHFLQNYTEQHGVEICGVNRNCME